MSQADDPRDDPARSFDKTRIAPERTVLAPPPSSDAGGNALPPGTRMHEFRIDGVIGEGGFGIVYLARDLQLERTVALKEYMPAALAARQGDRSIAVRSERHRETFDLGMRSFVNEAKLLASFDHPSLVKVYRFWEGNGTAYMVMPFYEGPTLKAQLKQMGSPPDEAWLKRLLAPLLDALETIHADHCFHRDIAPDNILLLGKDLKPLLLDFGAARRVIGDATQALTVILKPGYAPVEQYAEVPHMKQGAWTDVYGLSAVLYAAITGRAPTPSVGRLMQDDLPRLAEVMAGRYSAPFLAAIDAGLAVRPEERLQTIRALRERLFADQVIGDDEVTRIHTPVLPPPSAPRPGPERAASAPTAATIAVPTPARLAPTAFTQTPEEPPVPTARAGAPRRIGLLVGLGLAAAVAVGAGGWFALRGGNSTSSAAPEASAADEAKAAVASAPASGAEAPVPVVTPGEALAAAGTRGAFSAEAVLDDIVRNSDPMISVNALADRATLVIDRDRMQFRVKASEPGYLYLFYLGTGGDFMLLFPNARDGDNHVAADTEVVLPRKGWQLTASGPPGTDHIVAMVSRQPREFAGLKRNAAETIAGFDRAELERLWARAPAPGGSPFAGVAQCAGGATTCDAAFGATMLRIAEVAARK